MDTIRPMPTAALNPYAHTDISTGILNQATVNH